MSPPNSFLVHLRSAPYHPRSSKHSVALAEAIVTDLLATCKPLAAKAVNGEVVWDTDFDLTYGTATWNTDLVIGEPPPGTTSPLGEPIRKTAPSFVQIAIEIKGVMTEHRKAVKNRKRDLESHHQHVHSYNARTIAGGVMVLNIAERFKSPLRAPDDITTHKNPAALVEHCLSETRAVSVATGQSASGLDAKCALVVCYDNMDIAAARYHEKLPAPQIGDPIHYDGFIPRLCSEWSSRFGA